MELYQLRYFAEVARQQHFTRAAKRLSIAQPALSQQIHNLEAELGAPLFIRGRKQTRLTTAGEAFLAKAQQMLSLADEARQAVADIAQLRRGRLVIATIPTLSACWLPPVIQTFRKAHPHVELTLREESSEGVAELVENGVAELGFLQLPAAANAFEIQELFVERFVALLPARHSLGSRTFLKLGDLQAESFIFYKGKARAVVLEACQRSGFEPRVACETGELETVRALVAAGLGVAVVPQMAAGVNSSKFREVPLKRPTLERKLGLISRRGHVWSAAAKAFGELCRSAR